MCRMLHGRRRSLAGEKPMKQEKNMTIHEKMHNCRLYSFSGQGLLKEQTACLEKLYDFNMTRPTEGKKREEMLKEMFAEIGRDCYIEPPLHSNWGGRHVHFGNNVYANFGLTLVDDTHIYVGDYTMFAPHVTLATAGHPILPELREEAYQFNAPIHIGRNCWLGTGTIVLPGVSSVDAANAGSLRHPSRSRRMQQYLPARFPATRIAIRKADLPQKGIRMPAGMHCPHVRSRRGSSRKKS